MEKTDPSEQGRRSADMDILDCPLPEDPEERLNFYRGKREAEVEAQARRGVRRDVSRDAVALYSEGVEVPLK